MKVLGAISWRFGSDSWRFGFMEVLSWGHPGGPRASPVPRENTGKIGRFDPRTRTFSKYPPHRPLGRNFHPTAPGGVPSANPAPFLRNRSKSRGTAFRAPARNAHESVGRTVRPTAPWGVPSSYAFSTRIGAPRPRIPRVLPHGSNSDAGEARGGPRRTPGKPRAPPPAPARNGASKTS